MRSQAAALKALLDEPRLQVMPGCGDGMSARLILSSINTAAAPRRAQARITFCTASALP